MFRKGVNAIASWICGVVSLANLRNHEQHEGFRNQNHENIKTIAHRGVSNRAPENTMAAFRQALQMNCDYIELDLHMNGDGDLVVIHDTTVDRTTDGSGRVRNLSRKELKSFDAGSWFDPSFAGEKIPLFQEVLDTFGGKIGLLIELKKPSLYPGMIQKLVRILRNKHAELTVQGHPVMVQSFDSQALRQFHRMMPEIPIGVLISRRRHMKQRVLEELAQFADYINPKKTLIDPQSTAFVHSLGMEMMVWSLQKRENVLPLLSAGIDGIITDDPLFACKGSLQQNGA